eukprot:13647717-Alexandrium_andersonii.AAC.1
MKWGETQQKCAAGLDPSFAAGDAAASPDLEDLGQWAPQSCQILVTAMWLWTDLRPSQKL